MSKKLFLSSDYFSEKLVKLYQKPHFQKSVVAYWMGIKRPTGTIRTIWKVIKVLVK